MTLDLGNQVFVDWTSAPAPTDPAAAYAAWAAELGVSSTASLYALDGDDVVVGVHFAAPPLAGGVVGGVVGDVVSGTLSTEGGLGMYVRPPRNRTANTNATFTTRDATVIGRMGVFADGPHALLTWHPNADCKFVGARLQKANATTIVAGRVQLYNGEAFRTDFALRMDANVITLILAPLDQPVPVCVLDVAVGSVAGHTLETVAAGAVRRLVATLTHAPLPFAAREADLPRSAASAAYTGAPSIRTLPQGATGRRNHQIDAGQGVGRVRGSTLDYQAPVNRPYACRVVLLRERDMLAVREQWSQPDGSYDFQYVDELQSYTVLAYYGEHAKLAVVSDGLSLDNGKVERMP